jgi:hypothetical protein
VVENATSSQIVPTQQAVSATTATHRVNVNHGNLWVGYLALALLTFGVLVGFFEGTTLLPRWYTEASDVISIIFGILYIFIGYKTWKLPDRKDVTGIFFTNKRLAIVTALSTWFLGRAEYSLSDYDPILSLGIALIPLTLTLTIVFRFLTAHKSIGETNYYATIITSLVIGLILIVAALMLT